MYTHVSCEDIVYEEITSISNTVYMKRKKQAARSFHHTSETRHRCGRQRSAKPSLREHLALAKTLEQRYARSAPIWYCSWFPLASPTSRRHARSTLTCSWRSTYAARRPFAARRCICHFISATASAPFRCQALPTPWRWDPRLRCWSPTASNAHAIDGPRNDSMPSLTSHSYCSSPIRISHTLRSIATNGPTWL